MDDLSVGLSVCRFVQCIVENGGSDPDAVWRRRSDGSRYEAVSAVWGSVHGKGYFWGELEARHCNQWGLYGIRVQQRRDAAVFPNYFGQTCYHCILCFDAVGGAKKIIQSVKGTFGDPA